MAGIVVAVDRRGEIEPRSLDRALGALCHLPHFRPRALVETVRFALGTVERPEAPAGIHQSDEVMVVVSGHPLVRDPGWRVVSAAELTKSYLDLGVETLTMLAGSFVVAVVDHRAGRLEIVNDRTGSLPVIWRAEDGRFAAAPAAKAAAALLGWRPRIDREAAIAFLACGYPVGDRTLFEGARLLGPGHRLTVDLVDGSCSTSAYWDLRFRPLGLSRREAVEALHDVLLDAHRAVLCDRPERLQLLLTGGLDSRATLGVLAELQLHPSEALTWGDVDGLPGSDPVLARELAAATGVPFSFLHYDADSFHLRAREWCRVGELSSDNLGNFAAGADFLYRVSEPAPAILIGDQMLGPGGFPRDRGDAARAVTKVPPAGMLPALGGVVRPECRDEVGDCFNRQVARLAEACASDHPKDVQDYLFFHLYVVRWLHAAAYFREPMVSVRRPMMLDPVIELTSSFPRWLRVDKRALVELLGARMPHLMRIPSTSADSLVDWGYETRRDGPLRRMLLELLEVDRVAATPVGELLDQEAYRGFVDAHFSARVEPMDRGPSALPRVFALRRRLSVLPWLGRTARLFEPTVKRLMGWQPGAGAGQVVLRLAMLAMLQDELNAGDPLGVAVVRRTGGLKRNGANR